MISDINSSKIEGILLVDKPTGISTFGLIKMFKYRTKYSGKIGHTGTLDVFASGLVVLLLSRKFTTKFADFKAFTKEYEAGIRVGWSTPTLDVEGEFKKQEIEVNIEKEDLLKVIEKYIGKQEQEVPVYSATKTNGQSMYKKARKEGQISSGKSKEIDIKSIVLVGLKQNLVNLQVVSSGGTYIRQLTYDIFKELGYESFLYYLRRTKIGEYDLKNALNIEDLNKPGWEKHVVS